MTWWHQQAYEDYLYEKQSDYELFGSIWDEDDGGEEDGQGQEHNHKRRQSKRTQRRTM